MRPLQVRRFAVLPYDESLALQRQLVADRQAGRIADTLLLVEHPPVLTIGGSESRTLLTPARTVNAVLTQQNLEALYGAPVQVLSDSTNGRTAFLPG